MPARPHFWLGLVALDGWNEPPVVRLRGVLKRLLRSYGFRCISAEEVTDMRTVRELAELVKEMRIAQARWMCRDGTYEAYREADDRLDEAVRQVLAPAPVPSEEGE